MPSLRARRGAPPPPEQEPALLKRAAGAAHVALYAVLVGMSVSGGLAWFADVRPAADLHNVLKAALPALVALHVLAVIFHQLVLKSGIVTRMVYAER